MTIDALPDPTETLRTIEQRRLKSLVEADMDVADALHDPQFELVHPGGGIWSRARYLGGFADGTIDYRRFEPISDIEVLVSGDFGALRYRSAIDIQVVGQEAGELECWHTDCYLRDGPGAPWRVVWSPATAIDATTS